jgi:hypothetical protein
MIFADDGDLERVQPSVFGYGVASFEELHEVAGDEVVRDVRRVWGAIVGACGFGAYGDTPLRVPDWGVRNFDADRLNPVQWNSAALYRVLGWHVLPMLHSSVVLDGTSVAVDGMGLNELRLFYRAAYEEEFGAVLEGGLEYDLGSGYVVVNRRSVAELERLRR